MTPLTRHEQRVYDDVAECRRRVIAAVRFVDLAPEGLKGWAEGEVERRERECSGCEAEAREIAARRAVAL